MKPGETIGQLAKKKGITLRQLAIKADIPYNTLYAIVKRKSERIDLTTLKRIATALGVHPLDLIERREYDSETVDRAAQVVVNQEEYDKKTVAEAKDVLLHAKGKVTWTYHQARIIVAVEKMTPEGQGKVADYAEDILPRYQVPAPEDNGKEN